MNDWRDIKVGETYRIRNRHGTLLDRTIISVDAKKVVVQRDEDEEGKLTEAITDIFIKVYKRMGIEGQVEMDIAI